MSSGDELMHMAARAPNEIDIVRRIKEKMKKWQSLEDLIDKTMTTELWLFWQISELSDLKEELRKHPAFSDKFDDIINKMIDQLQQLMRRWSIKKNEIIMIMQKELLKGKKKIKSDGFTIEVRHGKTIMIYLNKGHGEHAEIPDLGLDENLLRAIRAGWRASDSSRRRHSHRHYGKNDFKPAMTTHFTWQVILWGIAHPRDKMYIYANGVHIAKSGINPRWVLHVNNYPLEWLDAAEAYQYISTLPSKELVLTALFYAILGDGSLNVSKGKRSIKLYNNSDRNLLEQLKKKIIELLKANGTVVKGVAWTYKTDDSNAYKLANEIIAVLPEKLKWLHDIMADKKFELIRLYKWARLRRISERILNTMEVPFKGLWFSLNYTSGSIYLRIQTKDKNEAMAYVKKLEEQGVNATINRHKKKRRGHIEDNYEVTVPWTMLKKYLCDPSLRETLIKIAIKKIERCKEENKNDCSKRPQAKWLRKLQNIEWIRENIGCIDNEVDYSTLKSSEPIN